MKKKIEKNDNKIKKLLETDIKNKIMIIVSIIIIVLIILITVLNKQKTITCKLYEDQSSNNYTRDTTYTITAKRNTVQSIPQDFLRLAFHLQQISDHKHNRSHVPLARKWCRYILGFFRRR